MTAWARLGHPATSSCRRLLPTLRAILLLAGLAVTQGPLHAQDSAAIEGQFRAWLETTVWPRAQAEGVSRAIFDHALTSVGIDWNLPDLVPPGGSNPTQDPQRQAEFASPAAYFRPEVVAATATAGRRMAARHAQTLAAVERATGVPGHIILAIWGRESAFGAADLQHDAFTVLATKGFMSPRRTYFTDELIAALRVAQAGLAPVDGLRSSWAGALGQPQFMPSSVLTYATDGDGDGRADIWGSEADTLASIGSYLARHGWVAGRDWGFEVAVPPSVSCALEGPDQGRPIAEWEALGIRRVSERPFPEAERGAEGYLMMPAGRHGPAFLVTPNFFVLKEYNTSDLYALFVGHVGDRIAFGVGDFAAGWDELDGLRRSDIAELQQALADQGHDVGGVDGLPGYKTRRSIGRWQEAAGLSPTCFPEPGLRIAPAP